MQYQTHHRTLYHHIDQELPGRGTHGQQDPTNSAREVVWKFLGYELMLEHHLEESIVTLWCPLHRNKALGLGHNENAGLDLLRMLVDHEKAEPEQAKEHPPVMTTESRTSQSQLQPETLSVWCHKQTPTDDVPVPCHSGIFFAFFRHFSTLFIHIFLNFPLCSMPIPFHFSRILWPIILFNSHSLILLF